MKVSRVSKTVPLALHPWSLALIFFIGIGLFSFARIAQISGKFGLLAEVYPSIIVEITNTERQKASLSPLVHSKTLTEAAQLKANDMAAKGYFAHTSPSGVTPWQWLEAVGYGFIYAGENLAINFDDSYEVQTAWLNSPTHRANIMNGNFSEIGVATAKGFYNGRETTFVVEMFGRPAVKTQPTVSTSQIPTTNVAGETAVPKQPIQVTNTTIDVQGTTITKYMEVKNADTTAIPIKNSTVEVAKLPWYKSLILKSDTIAALVISLLVIILFMATASLVAREYEKHHIKHVVQGTLLMVVLLGGLFAKDFGILRNQQKVPSVPYSSN